MITSLLEETCHWCDPRLGKVYILNSPSPVLSEINEIVSREVGQDYSMSPLACGVIMTASRICAPNPFKIIAISRAEFAASALTYRH
jgi:hypothetical protein